MYSEFILTLIAAIPRPMQHCSTHQLIVPTGALTVIKICPCSAIFFGLLHHTVGIGNLSPKFFLP